MANDDLMIDDLGGKVKVLEQSEPITVHHYTLSFPHKGKFMVGDMLKSDLGHIWRVLKIEGDLATVKTTRPVISIPATLLTIPSSETFFLST